MAIPVAALTGSILVGLILVGGAAAQTPAQTPAQPPAQATGEKPMPPRVETVGRSRAEGVLGQPVLDAKGQAIGHVVDVLIDQEGRPQAAVIEFAGFLGLGDRDVAVDWKALRFAVQNDRILIHVALEPAALKAMPLYKPAAKSVPVATPARRAASDTAAKPP